jgi:very-short-patch-repair endonuclease
VLDHRPEGKPARSGFEVMALDVLRGAGMRHWLRRHTVVVDGIPVAEIDLANVEHMVAVEPNGARWHSTRRAVLGDQARIALLRSLGWTIVETTWDEVVHHPEVLIARVRAVLCVPTSV